MWSAFVPLVASLVASVSAADVIGTGVETLDANATLRYALGGHERAGLECERHLRVAVAAAEEE